MDYEDWYDKYEGSLVTEYQKLVDAGLRDYSDEDWNDWVEEQWKVWKDSTIE